MSINYELAKRLKDAGFPQKEEDNSGLISFYISPRGSIIRWDYRDDEDVFLPTLSELIEACLSEKVDDWFSLNENWYEGSKTWRACMNHGVTRPEDDGYGSTPEEAVANLWLELNKK